MDSNFTHYLCQCHINQQTVHITLNDIDSFLSPGMNWRITHWHIGYAITGARIAHPIEYIVFISQEHSVACVCVCLCVRVLIELWVCHAYLICSCVISYNIQLLQCRDNGRIDLISGERADGHRDLLIASLIPGEYAFLKSVWVFFSGFRFVLNRWTKKATTSKSK